MRSIRDRAGFTLIEMIIVLVIVGVVSAMAAPNLVRWQLREDARSHATYVSQVLARARSTALHNGTPTFVLFNAPGIAQSTPTEFAMIVEDNDADGLIGPTDTWINFDKKQDTAVEVDGYGRGPAANNIYAGAVLAPEDAGGGGNLGGLVGASTFPVAPAPYNVPAVGFTPPAQLRSAPAPPSWRRRRTSTCSAPQIEGSGCPRNRDSGCA